MKSNPILRNVLGPEISDRAHTGLDDNAGSANELSQQRVLATCCEEIFKFFVGYFKNFNSGLHILNILFSAKS